MHRVWRGTPFVLGTSSDPQTTCIFGGLGGQSYFGLLLRLAPVHLLVSWSLVDKHVLPGITVILIVLSEGNSLRRGSCCGRLQVVIVWTGFQLQLHLTDRVDNFTHLLPLDATESRFRVFCLVVTTTRGIGRSCRRVVFDHGKGREGR